MSPTQTPWGIITNNGKFMCVRGANDELVLGNEAGSGYVDLADAEFIVRAVNSHEALLDAAKKARALVGEIGDHDSWTNAVYLALMEAIDQAEGK